MTREELERAHEDRTPLVWDDHCEIRMLVEVVKLLPCGRVLVCQLPPARWQSRFDPSPQYLRPATAEDLLMDWGSF